MYLKCDYDGFVYMCFNFKFDLCILEKLSYLFKLGREEQGFIFLLFYFRIYSLIIVVYCFKGNRVIVKNGKEYKIFLNIKNYEMYYNYRIF